MTREELIARIEAGGTGCWVDMEVARAAGLNAFVEDEEAVYVKERPGRDRQILYEVMPYTTSLDAAVSLVGDRRWSVHHDGVAVVWPKGAVFGKTAQVANNPAAALVAAWLKATA